MKIISYNVNGIRAAINKGFVEWLKVMDPDVICLQEIKAMKEQVPVIEFELAGYPYHYWYSADKKGYSGVAIISKTRPDHVEYGTGIQHMDLEGRNIRADFGDISVMSFYMPSGTNSIRIPHKFMYMADFSQYINELAIKIPNLIICGDYNICHQAIDIHDPVRNKNVSGFLPQERDWLDEFINDGFVDSFRHLNKDPHHYTWWSNFNNARANNKGWRIDYIMISKSLIERLRNASIMPDARHSDHCPIMAEIE